MQRAPGTCPCPQGCGGARAELPWGWGWLLWHLQRPQGQGLSRSWPLRVPAEPGERDAAGTGDLPGL